MVSVRTWLSLGLCNHRTMNNVNWKCHIRWQNSQRRQNSKILPLFHQVLSMKSSVMIFNHTRLVLKNVLYPNTVSSSFYSHHFKRIDNGLLYPETEHDDVYWPSLRFQLIHEWLFLVRVSGTSANNNYLPFNSKTMMCGYLGVDCVRTKSKLYTQWSGVPQNLNRKK